MSLKRECDRCHHLTPVDSLNGKDFRVVQIDRGGARVDHGGGTITPYKSYDLCKLCAISLEAWLETAPVMNQRADAPTVKVTEK